MDSLTHLVLGHAMGTLAGGATPALQAGAYWGALVGNSLPDMDVPIGTLMGRGWAFHRKFTHTVPGVFVLTLVASTAITQVVPGSSFGITWVWALAGSVVHVALDCLNTRGTRPLWPFSNRRIGYGVLFIMDPFILSTLGIGSIGNLAGWIPDWGVHVLCFVVLLYIPARWLVQVRLHRMLESPGVLRCSVVPFFVFWRYFRQTAARLEYGKITLRGDRLIPLETVETAEGPVVEASRSDPRAQNFLRGARYPFARVEPNGDGFVVRWEDLFSRLRGWRAGVEVRLDRELRVL